MMSAQPHSSGVSAAPQTPEERRIDYEPFLPHVPLDFDSGPDWRGNSYRSQMILVTCHWWTPQLWRGQHKSIEYIELSQIGSRQLLARYGQIMARLKLWDNTLQGYMFHSTSFYHVAYLLGVFLLRQRKKFYDTYTHAHVHAYMLFFVLNNTHTYTRYMHNYTHIRRIRCIITFVNIHCICKYIHPLY